MKNAFVKLITNTMIAILLFVTSTTLAFATDVYVIANTISIDGKNLSYSDIEDIFTLRSKKWSNGSPIRVFLLPRNNPRTREFSQKYLNMSANRYYDLIENRESSGKGNIAHIVETEYGIMLKVLTTPGSIGYASDSVVINYSGNIVIIK